jgi:hypothetical protein
MDIRMKKLIVLLLILASVIPAYGQKRVDQLTERTSTAATDIFMVGYDSGGGSYLYRKVQMGNAFVAYTEPATNLPLCRTGSKATGSCTAIPDSLLDPPTTTVGSGASARTTSTNGEYVFCTATCTVTPKTPIAGAQLCVKKTPGATATDTIKLAAIASTYYSKTDNTGWQTTANKYLISGGTALDQICIVGYDSTHYLIMNSTGTWTSE